MSDESGMTGERREQPRKTWKQVMDEEVKLQIRSDRMTYEAIRSGRLGEDDFLSWMNELRDQATRDKLTGLENRREFLTMVHREMVDSSRNNRQLSVVELDIDHFKAINDTYGHPVGDEVLRYMGAMACYIGSQVEGRFYRVGGEEFMVILPDIHGKHLTDVVQAIGNSLIDSWVNNESLKQQGVGNVTLSMGVCTNKPGEKLSQFLERVDKCLYLAKRADEGDEGRQRAVIENADGQLTKVSFRKCLS